MPPMSEPERLLFPKMRPSEEDLDLDVVRGRVAPLDRGVGERRRRAGDGVCLRVVHGSPSRCSALSGALAGSQRRGTYAPTRAPETARKRMGRSGKLHERLEAVEGGVRALARLEPLMTAGWPAGRRASARRIW